MTSKIWEDLVEKLTTEQVISLMSKLGSSHYKTDNEGNIVFQSICHNSDSYKLCYYPETKTFFCYREWEKFTIYSLVMRVLGVDFQEAFKYVSDIIGYKSSNVYSHGSFISGYSKEDWNYFDRYSTIQTENENETDTIFTPDLLNLYDDFYYQGWIDEHINISTMQKYNIKCDIANNRIIIPHYDVKGNLIGIRSRNLDPNANAKYCPIQIDNKWYTHSLSNHLYGLDKNKETIKKTGKILITESEKSVMQSETFFPEKNFTVACCGSNVSFAQIDLMLKLGVTEVQIGMDLDFHEIGINQEYLKYKEHIYKLARKLIPYFTVYYVTTFNQQSTGYKYSPTDFGKEILIEMMKHKILITNDLIETELPIISAQLSNLERTINVDN